VAASGELGCTAFRGSEVDVLSRYYLAAVGCAADIVVRVTSDCPLFDGEVLEAMLDRFVNLLAAGTHVDYLSNTLERSFPRGLDAEIFSFAVLKQAQFEATQSFEREHVTPFIYGHPERFKLRNFSAAENCSRYRWTLDTVEDWQFVEAVYVALNRPGKVFGMVEVLELLRDRPELAMLNAHVEQKKLIESS
jgi:spore coat polysaccharide biosynthesis protein SpsF